MEQQRNLSRKSYIPLLVIFILMISASSLFPQYEFYYGKNKVVRHVFHWKRIELPHFNLYHYTEDENLIKKIAKAAENGYSKIYDYLGVKIKDKVPIIFYSTHIEFEQTNIAEYLPPGVVAFAEPRSYRLVLQGDAPFDELETTIIHELAHLFEYAIMGESVRFISPPLWIMEGFAELMTNKWSEFSLLTVRDMVLFDRIPQLTKYGELETPYHNDRIIPYDFGHMVFEFLDKKFGKRGVKQLLYSLRGNSILRMAGRADVLKVLDYTPKMFNYEFGKYARERFRSFEGKENPEDYSYIIGPDMPYVYSFTHQVSPSGEMLAILTVSLKTYTIDIILISMKDGKVIKKITSGFTSRYDNINLKFDPTDGVSFVWNKNNNEIAFFARREMDNYLVTVDILSGKILKQIKIENIQDPSSPTFSPDNEKKLYFTGQVSGKSYIYSIDLETQQTTRVTNGVLFIKALDISRDGKRIAFSAKNDGHYKLFLGTLDSPEMAKQITFGDYNDITPSFSSDSGTIYYSSNETGSYNIDSIDIERKRLSRYTDVKTGNFFPIEIPGEKNMVVMSSYYKGMFRLFKKDISTSLETRPIEFELIDTAKLAREEAQAIDVTGIDMQDKGKYVPLKKLYIKSLPPVAVALGTDGGFFGYTELTLTDLMGDYNFSLLLATFYGYRSYHLSYLNQRHRLQFYGHLFSYQDVYYYNGYVSQDYLTLRSMYGGEAGFFYPFNRSHRAELTAALYKQKENFSLYSDEPLPYGQFANGWAVPVRFSLIGETTLFANYGPNRGHTFNFTLEKYLKLGNKFIDAYSAEADVRKYLRLDNNTLLAFRLAGFHSGGKTPLIFWTGGNNTIRSADYRTLTGNNMFLFNAEFRFSLVRLADTPIGLIGPIRGVLFFDLGGIWYKGQPFRMFQKDNFPRLQDAVSSYGFGLEIFAFGYPMHIEWVWRNDLSRKAYYGVNFWIGYDF